MADKAEAPAQGDSGKDADAKTLIMPWKNADYGPVIAQVKGLVEDHLMPKPIILVDPITGAEAPGYMGADGLHATDPRLFDGYLEAPRFRKGAAAFTSIDSLIEHVNRFKDDDSVVFAIDDRSAPKITTVLNYHRAGADGDARFGDHRSTFNFPLSDEWKAWAEQDKKPMSMIDFAAFLEDRIVDVLDQIAGEDSLPEDLQKFVNAVGGRIAGPTRLLELSLGLKVHENSNVSEAVNLSSGEAHIQFVSEHVDGSGAPLKVPNLFLIGIPVFKNGQFYRIAARLRYRKTAQGLIFWYELWRSDRVFDHAFRDGCERVRVETDLPLLFGTPE